MKEQPPPPHPQGPHQWLHYTSPPATLSCPYAQSYIVLGSCPYAQSLVNNLYTLPFVYTTCFVNLHLTNVFFLNVHIFCIINFISSSNSHCSQSIPNPHLLSTTYTTCQRRIPKTEICTRIGGIINQLHQNYRQTDEN